MPKTLTTLPTVASIEVLSCADAVGEPNGVYIYGASAFPNLGFLGGNYWVDVVYTASTQLAPPQFLPPGGTYPSSLPVTLISATPGAQIYYTTNGSTPTISSSKYTQPVAVNSTTTLKAIAVAPGWTTSSVGSATYNIVLGQTARPTFTPDTGTYYYAVGDARFHYHGRGYLLYD